MRSATFGPTPGVRATIALSRIAIAEARSAGLSVPSTASATLAPTPCTVCSSRNHSRSMSLWKAEQPDLILAHMGFDRERRRFAGARQLLQCAGRAMHQIADAVDVDNDGILAVAVDHAFELADHRAAPCHRMSTMLCRWCACVTAMASASAASSRARVGLGQKHADHHAHLRLVAMAGADDAFLHQVRRVFGNRHAGPRRHHHGNAAGLAELERRGRILVDEGRFDGGLIGTVVVEDARQSVVDGEKPQRQRGAIIRLSPSRSR